MAISYESLRDSPKVFKSLTGLTLQEFEALATVLVPRLKEFDQLRHAGPGRRRSAGGGRRYNLSPRTRIMLALVRLRHDLTRDVLGCLFGVCGSTAARTMSTIFPLLEEAWDDARSPRPPAALYRPEVWKPDLPD
jgi:hypothetical protein